MLDINRQKLYKSKYENVLRLAKSLGVSFKECCCQQCKTEVIEKIVRIIQQNLAPDPDKK